MNVAGRIADEGDPARDVTVGEYEWVLDEALGVVRQRHEVNGEVLADLSRVGTIGDALPHVGVHPVLCVPRTVDRAPTTSAPVKPRRKK